MTTTAGPGTTLAEPLPSMGLTAASALRSACLGHVQSQGLSEQGVDKETPKTPDSALHEKGPVTHKRIVTFPGFQQE